MTQRLKLTPCEAGLWEVTIHSEQNTTEQARYLTETRILLKKIRWPKRGHSKTLLRSGKYLFTFKVTAIL